MKKLNVLLSGILIVATLAGCSSSVKPIEAGEVVETSEYIDVGQVVVPATDASGVEIPTDPTEEYIVPTESGEETTEPVVEPTEPSQPTQPSQPTEPDPTQPTEPAPIDPKPSDPTEPPHTHSYTSKVTKAATCTENGVTTYTCSCGDSYTKNEPKALGHNTGSWTVTKEATCTQSGTKTRSCQRSGCSYKETDTIPATGHNWGSWKQTQAPTCTAKGKEQRTCSRCNKTESRDVPALGHKWDNGTVTTQPTCGNAGVRTYHCKRTGCSKTKTEVIPATGNHSWKQTQAPTCTNNGTETCSVCHKTRSVNALGHDWEYHPAETETVSVFYCDCGAKFYSYEDWNAHSDSYWGTDDEDSHCGYMATSEDHVIKPAYNKCKRCGMENPA